MDMIGSSLFMARCYRSCRSLTNHDLELRYIGAVAGESHFAAVQTCPARTFCVAIKLDERNKANRKGGRVKRQRSLPANGRAGELTIAAGGHPFHRTADFSRRRDRASIPTRHRWPPAPRPERATPESVVPVLDLCQFCQCHPGALQCHLLVSPGRTEGLHYKRRTARSWSRH